MKRLFLIALLGTALLSACGGKDKDGEGQNGDGVDSVLSAEVQGFLDEYTTEFQRLYYESAEAQWKSNTEIIPDDTTNDFAARKADEAYAAFTGSVENIEKTREFLKSKDKLTPLQVRQLETILYSAANNPQTVKELVDERIAAETKQNTDLFGFSFSLNGKKVSTNDLDRILRESSNVRERMSAWLASKEVGKPLKEGLINLRRLRNETVKALGYDDYFSYQVSDYGMTRQEMMEQMSQLMKDIWPLYRELHTYARHELTERYGRSTVPEYLPAHWLPNRWGQDWSSMVEVEGIDLDGQLKEKGPEWLIKQAERFYVSLGFDELPASFYEKSSLYPLPADATYSKNNHASAWHMDLDHDVRSLMSVEPNTEWYETTHHELGHIYYYLSYTNPDVPPLLRGGANRGYHEAMGSLLGLAAMQKPFMEGLGLVEPGTETDEMKTLLKEALNYIVFIPFGAGVMSSFEHDLYAENLPEDQINARWWEYKKKFQGIVPPGDGSGDSVGLRGEEFCDACSKTHINNDAAQYYDYAISYALLFQFHDHIATKILKQDPHATNYFGNKEVGSWLESIMHPGASRDWRELLEEKTGAGLGGKALADYFAPLMDWLKKENEGRTHTLPEQFPG